MITGTQDQFPDDPTCPNCGRAGEPFYMSGGRDTPAKFLICRACGHRWPQEQALVRPPSVRRISVDGQLADRRVWVESGVYEAGEVIDVELRNGEWVQCRIDGVLDDALWVTRLQ